MLLLPGSKFKKETKYIIVKMAGEYSEVFKYSRYASKSNTSSNDIFDYIDRRIHLIREL